jgi:hypothetical protein
VEDTRREMEKKVAPSSCVHLVDDDDDEMRKQEK